MRNEQFEFRIWIYFFESSWSPCGLCWYQWYAINGSNRARMVKISRCMFSFYPIISFTDVCSISESGFNLGRLDRNTDTNDNIPTIDQTVMVWKRTRKSFSVRTGGFSYVYRSLSQKKKLVLLHCGNSNIRINFFIKPLIPAEVKIGINHACPIVWHFSSENVFWCLRDLLSLFYSWWIT